jgi:hypothetical protein
MSSSETTRPDGDILIHQAGDSAEQIRVLLEGESIWLTHAQSWGEQRYDTFTERPRLDAEQQAEARYLDDLRSSAKVLQGERLVMPAKKKAPVKKQRPNAGKTT